MKKKILFCLLVLPFLCYSQGEANIWYFGNEAGLDFNSGISVALPDGQINTSEGSAVISNATGQLLFYTDGVTVWNRNHQIMSNGNNLLGHSSSTQSAVIIPKPGSINIYYIITSSASDVAPQVGVRYSEVDMSLNGGLGDVTVNKNLLLLAPSCEKIAVVKKDNGLDYWIVIHAFNSNSFLTYSLTASGINTIPVVSSVGPVIDTVEKSLGYLKFSPDGTKLINASKEIGVLMFDFDITNGSITNPRPVSNRINCYGVEISVSGNIAYVTGGEVGFNLPTNKLFQYDLTAANIPASELLLYTETAQNTGLGAVQLAVDGKIYVANVPSSFVGVVNNPEVFGSGCNFVSNQVSLGTKICRLGLPQFIQSYFNTSIIAQNFCLGSNTEFALNSTQTLTSVLWDFGDGNISTDFNPSHQYLNPGNYNVTVTVTSALGSSTKNKNITISTIPIISNTINSQSICGVEGMSYDLSQFNNIVLGTQSNAVFGVSYFSSMSDVFNHINGLSTNFSLPLGITTFYAKVFNILNSSCYSVTSFTVDLQQQPTANTPSDFVICENQPYDNIEQFDLTTKNSEVLNGQQASGFTITYHATQSDASLNIAALPYLYTNALSQETLHARIENNSNSDCFDVTSFQLKVIQQPQISPVTDFTACDDISNNGIEIFDLSLKTVEVLNGQSPSVFQVKYFLSFNDAQNDLNEVVATMGNSINNQIIYYSISAINNNNCKSIGSFKLIVLPYVVANAPANIFICDDVGNDGIALFNLDTNVMSILGSQPASQFTVSYHLSQNDADSDVNPLPLNYQNISNPQYIFVRVENNQNYACFATASFQIGLYKMPVANQPQNLFLCDDETNDGKGIFDLSQQTLAILDTQLSTDFNISYYLSLNDANTGTNDLNLNFSNTINPQTIYSRIENRDSALCFDVTSFELIVRPKPILPLNDEYSICEGNSITITAPLGFSSYEWSNGDVTNTITITQSGNYFLTVTKDYGDIVCDVVKNIVVNNSNIAVITNIETRDWTDIQNAITVHVTGDGDYEYSLDGINYQDNNFFTGLYSGQYMVYVRDKKGCGVKLEEVFLLMYPKFFTPNGDGVNDTWQIEFSLIEPDIEIIIFDRYGKLISKFKGSNFGWDGTYNGQLMPSTDYWFVVKRQNGEECKGHFALIR